MLKILAIALSLVFFQVNAQEVITTPSELKNLKDYFLSELQLSRQIVSDDFRLSNHLQDFEKGLKNGSVRVDFTKGDKANRGSQYSDDGCGCSIINISSEYIESGAISTLIHEFQHVKQELLVNELIKSNKDLDLYTDIFGEFYYQKNKSLASHAKFKDALYVGAALLFYMEYDAFKIQKDAIVKGVKDKIRTERDNDDILETVANEYFINHDINVNIPLLRHWQQMADRMDITAFVTIALNDKSARDYLFKIQK